MDTLSQHSLIVKTAAAAAGFDYCGIARAVRLDADAKRLENWLNKGMHGKMQYMENHFELRIDPSKLVPGAKSVITLLLNYFPAQKQDENAVKISKYAFGKDYHEVIRNKLKLLTNAIKEKTGEFNGRGFVDSAPVLERTWATRSGLGWIGKNGNLITKGNGSFFFIATLITDLDLSPDDEFAKDYCGTCRKCIDACPTEALREDKVVDGSRCISYYTIELKEMLIPGEMKGKFDNWMFGCDTCQDVCPWNRFASSNSEIEFAPIHEILEYNIQDWESLSEDSFKKIFKDSPLKRSKWIGIQRNIKFIQEE